MVKSCAECNFTMPAERMAHWRHQYQADLGERKTVQFRAWIDGLPDNTDIAAARRDCSNNLAASVMLKADVDIRMGREKGRERYRQKFHRADIRQQAHMSRQPITEIVEVAAHLLELLRDNPRVVQEHCSCRSEPNPPATTMSAPTIKFDDGAAYEWMMGKWSRLIGGAFVDWLSPPPNLRWVDIGCGNGAFTQLLVERCAPMAVEGVDPSEGQLVFARERLTTPVASFRQGDAMALPSPMAASMRP